MRSEPRSRARRGAVAIFAFILAALLIGPALPADASLVLNGLDQTSGTGLGAVSTILTLNEVPPDDQVHSGCVEWTGSSDATGAAVCPSPFDGADEQASTQTRTLAEMGLTNAVNLRIVFNYNEPQSGPSVNDITVEDMVLTLFNPDGSVCFDSGPFTPESFLDTFSGVGNSGFVFRLDTEQALQAQPCFDDPQSRIGLGAQLSGAGQGPETFYVARATELLPSSADLSLTKADSTDPVAPSTQFTYILTVTNNGPNTATGVQVVDTLPTDVTYVSSAVTVGGGSCSESGGVVTCDLGTVPAGETREIEITVTSGTQGTVLNNAVVSGDEPDPNPGNNSASEETTVTGGTATATVDVSMVKTGTPDPVAVGATLTYTLTVRNAGPDTALGVTVTDQLPSSVTFGSVTPNDETGDGSDSCARSNRTVSCQLGDLGAGEVETVTIQVTPTATGQIDNFAQVSSEGDDTAPGNNSDDERTTVVTDTPADQVDLVLTKTDSADPVAVGEDFTYTLSIENRGTTDATGVTVTDNLPANANFISASAECSYLGGGTGGTVTCDLGTLAAGAMDSVTITVDSSTTGALTNSAVVIADQDDINPGDNSASESTLVTDGGPTPEPVDLSVTKADSMDPVPVGVQFDYTFTISNAEPNGAGNVTLVDSLPVEVSYVGSADSCNHDGSPTGGTVTCDAGTIAAGSFTTVTFTVMAESEGFADDFASVSADEPDSDSSNNTATERTTIGTPLGVLPSADLVILKSASPDPVEVGGVLTYSLTVTNNGPDAATGVQVSDALPASVSCLTATSPDGTCSCPASSTGGFVICDLGTLSTGDSAIISIEVEPTTAGTVRNTAAVSGNEPDPDPTDNSDETETTVSPGDGSVLPIPTLNEVALVLLALMLGIGGLWFLRT